MGRTKRKPGVYTKKQNPPRYRKANVRKALPPPSASNPGRVLEEAQWMWYCGDREGARDLLLWLIAQTIEG